MSFPNIPGRPAPQPYRFPTPRKPDVVLPPKTYREMLKGINLIAQAVRPTLGPLPRLVLIEGLKRTDRPEFLDDGATIARRIIQIKPRSRDVGAMLIRQALWKMHEQVGDGSTTMAVMYQRIFQEGVRYITQFGCNPMLLRSGLEKGLRAILQNLHQDTTPLIGKEKIAQIAGGMCQGDLELADLLAEIFDIVGADGLIEIEGGNRGKLEREYIEGTYWNLSGWFSHYLLNEQDKRRCVYEDAALLITDMELKDPTLLVPVLEKCVKNGIKKLVVIAKEVSDRVIGLLVNNNKAKTIETVAVRTPKVLEMDRVASMDDIAVLTGGRAIYARANPSFDDFLVEDLGYARRAWATESQFGIYGGKGDPRQIRHHIAEVKGTLHVTDGEHDRKYLRDRIGRLSSGTAIMRVGGITESEIETRKGIASRAVAGLKNALAGGVVLGGGVALLNYQAALEGLAAGHEDEAIAYKILGRALEEPLRTIAQNAGYSPDVMVEKIKGSPKGHGLDARIGKIVEMSQHGILDSTLVLEKALEIAISGAAIALTTDVIVHLSQPVESVEP